MLHWAASSLNQLEAAHWFQVDHTRSVQVSQKAAYKTPELYIFTQVAHLATMLRIMCVENVGETVTATLTMLMSVPSALLD